MKIMEDKWKPSCAYQKIDTFHGEHEWDTKEGPGKCIVQYVQWSGSSLVMQ